MNLSFLFFYFLSSAKIASAEASSINLKAPQAFAKFLESSIKAKDAPAACWYLGNAEGYLRALMDMGNLKAKHLLTETKDDEGKCGGKNGFDLKATFTLEEWLRLETLTHKISSTDLE